MKKIIILILSLFWLISCSKTKELTIYTPLEDDQIPDYLESFKKKYPDIKLNIVRDSTGIITARLLAEKDNPRADVIWGCAATSLLFLEEVNLLEPYAPKGLERVLPEFRDSYNPPKWVGIDVWETAIIVNTIEAKKKNIPLPLSYADLIKPIYKGMIVMPNPASSGTGFLTVSAILQLMGEEKGWAYLEKLHQNMALYTHSGSKPAKLAGKGEFPIGISFGYRGITQKKKGEPVETIFPVEGSGWDLEANALVKKPNIKPEAKLFLDWAISDEVMAKYNKNFAIISIKTNNPIPEGYKKNPIEQLIRNDLKWAAKNRERILKTWNEKFGAKTEAKK